MLITIYPNITYLFFRCQDLLLFVQDPVLLNARFICILCLCALLPVLCQLVLPLCHRCIVVVHRFAQLFRVIAVPLEFGFDLFKLYLNILGVYSCMKMLIKSF